MAVIPLMALLLLIAPVASAEIYIYQGPNGERMITDRPPHSSSEYDLVAKRDSISDAGHLMANRTVDTGGPETFRVYIRSASQRYKIDSALIEAVIQVESGFDPNAVSRAGATGLMQLMQKTAQHYQVTNRFNPRQNIHGGAAHLRDLMDRYKGELTLVLAAYNAGATAVSRYKGVPPFPETQRYIGKVLKAHAEILRYRSDKISTIAYRR